jgi:hypothetical protein
MEGSTDMGVKKAADFRQPPASWEARLDVQRSFLGFLDLGCWALDVPRSHLLSPISCAVGSLDLGCWALDVPRSYLLSPIFYLLFLSSFESLPVLFSDSFAAPPL